MWRSANIWVKHKYCSGLPKCKPNLRHGKEFIIKKPLLALFDTSFAGQAFYENFILVMLLKVK